jgi:regulatory protein
VTWTDRLSECGDSPFLSKIVDLRPSRKSTSFIEVECANGCIFRLLIQDVADLQLKLGQTIDETVLRDLRASESRALAWDAALRKLSRRSHTIQEMRQFLRGKEFSHDATEWVIEKFTEMKLLDDDALVADYIQRRQALQSKRALQYRLAQRGVDRGQIQKALSEFNDESAARALAEKYCRQRSLDHSLASQRKLLMYLQRKGFDYDICLRVAILDNDWDEPII